MRLTSVTCQSSCLTRLIAQSATTTPTTLTAETSSPTTTAAETDDPSMIKTLRYDQPSIDVVANRYDTVTSFGSNAIEVLSTHKDGGSKSIIISRPVGRKVRDVRHEWRSGRILTGRNSGEGQNPVWRKPLPTSNWYVAEST